MAADWRLFARRIRVPTGFLFAVFFLWRAHSSWRSLGWSLALVVPGLLLRAYASGYVDKNTSLAVTGPYAYTRNPLYLGSMIMAFGFALASRSWLIGVLLAVLFAVIYGPTILAEEDYLRKNFSEFNEYVQRVPRLLPRFGAKQRRNNTSAGEFSWALYLQHGEYNALLGACAIYAALLARMFFRR